ncbi:NAD(P)H-hydrate dehydratase [Paenibacillus sp. GP183]|uniref:NAD(P)H-hydrate dehydratase n=1 Tax=Paenibacillus sp. GP183 TaxID=1882751 RepID=UPI00089AF243|nr:NAD(P)H-hydrate dehydratase [Paenibacillus sp. GP183]SEB70015.1 NAD(P)H-hydrate epimerase [Paenibacillus sp. GP183]
MYVVTAEEMKKLERETIERIGFPAILLMENAARGVADAVLKAAETVGRCWLVLVGKGNNGADGLAAARHLVEAGLEVSIVYAEKPDDDCSKETAMQRQFAIEWGIVSSVAGDSSIPWERYDGIIDALLGTGSKGAPRRQYASLIIAVNDSQLPIISVDIPSGINADTGEVYVPCIQAVHTVTFAFSKRGLLQFPGASRAGKVTVCPIGIPVQLAEQLEVRTFRLDPHSLTERLGVDSGRGRAADGHKGTYGHVLLAAGSRSMSGAGLLSSQAALRGGCGLASWALPGQLVLPLLGRVPELMLLGLGGAAAEDWSAVPPQALAEQAEGKDALVLGPGMGRWSGDSAWLRAVWDSTECPLVLDADALNMLADAADFAAWPVRKTPVVLTPHPGEMGRLAGLSVAEVQRDRIALARSYAQQHQVVLVLKGAGSVVAAPSGAVYLNTTGNPGMATGGTGDILAGLIGSLLAQGLSAEQAAALGVYTHGAAGDRAAAKRDSAASLIAGDLLDEL